MIWWPCADLFRSSEGSSKRRSACLAPRIFSARPRPLKRAAFLAVVIERTGWTGTDGRKAIEMELFTILLRSIRSGQERALNQAKNR